jgi:hypothetical protein
MRALIRMLGAGTVALCTACAAGRPAYVEPAREASDSLDTHWGDESDEPVEAALPGHPARGMTAEWVREGATHRARLDASVAHASVRVRSASRGDVGTLRWRGGGALREIAVGHVVPSIAQGALCGDASASADLSSRAPEGMEGLRMDSGASPWTARRGGGVVAGFGAYRVGVGGCESSGEPAHRVGFASVERCRAGGTLGAAVAARVEGGSSRAASIYASRSDAAFSAGAETAVCAGRVRSVVRMAAGERRSWSAVLVAGAGPAREEPLVFDRRSRWGAALERRDLWMRGESRVAISSLTRRDDASDVRRRRLSCEGRWRITPYARLELAARITSEAARGFPDALAGAAPRRDAADEWRARATLRARQAGESGWQVENTYRLEWVQNRSGRPGTLAGWSLRWQAGPLEGGGSAAAHALHGGQVAYEASPEPLASGEYAPLTGRGARVSAWLRVRLGPHAWLEGTWTQRSPSPERIWLSAGVRI